MDHTPGPWEVVYLPYPCARNGEGESNPPAAFIGSADRDEAVALVFGDPDDDPFDSPSQRSNAKLIAAAPDLFDAAEWLMHLVCGIGKAGGPPEQGEFEAAQNALMAALARTKGNEDK